MKRCPCVVIGNMPLGQEGHLPGRRETSSSEGSRSIIIPIMPRWSPPFRQQAGRLVWESRDAASSGAPMKEPKVRSKRIATERRVVEKLDIACEAMLNIPRRKGLWRRQTMRQIDACAMRQIAARGNQVMRHKITKARFVE